MKKVTLSVVVGLYVLSWHSGNTTTPFPEEEASPRFCSQLLTTGKMTMAALLEGTLDVVRRPEFILFALATLWPWLPESTACSSQSPIQTKLTKIKNLPTTTTTTTTTTPPSVIPPESLEVLVKKLKKAG